MFFTENNSQTSNAAQFEQKFTSPLLFRDLEVAVVSAVIPNSFMNFQSGVNDSFSYIYNGTGYPVTLGTSYLDIAAINNAMWAQMKTNNHFMKDSLGNPVFFIQLTENLAQYNFAATFTPLAVPTGGTNSNTLVLGNTMQLVVPSTNSFGRRIGFIPGTFPLVPSPLIQIITSTVVPQISDLQCVVLTLPGFVSSFSTGGIGSSVCYIPINAGFGSNITYTPTNLLWYRVMDNTYTSIKLVMVSQTGLILNALDPNVSICLQFRQRLKSG